MSQLRPAQLGPLVGHTTTKTARIWIRGGTESESATLDPQRRTVGVIAVFEEGGKRLRAKPAYYFRLRREYDRTGTFTLGEELGLQERPRDLWPLKPNTEYLVRVGTLSVDDPHPEGESLDSSVLDQRLPDPKVWITELEGLDAEQAEARFRTFPDGNTAAENLSFMLGSCRYPGLLWRTRHADAIFGPMLEEARGRDGRPPANFSLMVGDQIYADRFNRHIPLGLADTFAEFQERYHAAFSSANMRRLLRHLPTYMILDDHEIEDNWTQDRIRSADSRQVFNLAIHTYMSYQWVHGPSCFGNRLYYNFECAGLPFFVLDTRTQRYMDDVAKDLSDNHLLGRPSLDPGEPSQLELLLSWLSSCQQKLGDRPKFIVTSSVFAPNPIAARTKRQGSPEQVVQWKEDSDSWPAFPETRSKILSHIVAGGIQNVVFLSGDIHCANVAKIELSGSPAAKKLRSFSITSSAFYWPFPFADGDPSNFVHDSRASGQEDGFEFQVGTAPHEMHYKAWNFTQDDNFCRVDVDPDQHRIVVTPFGSDGKVIEKGGWFGSAGEPIESVLELAPW